MFPTPGVIKLSVDATDLAHAIFTVHETVPVAGPGPIVLQYPKWLPGNHSPSGPIDKLAGLVVHAGGQRLEWTRDPVDVYAFHVDAPAGATTLDLDFQFLSPVSTREGRVVMTQQMLNVEWNADILYPAGYFSRDIQVQPSVKLPTGWTAATALDAASKTGDVIDYKTTTLNTLVDSPLIAGEYFKAFDLDPGGPARVTLDVIADRPADLDAKPDQINAHKALVQQAYKLYGSHHYGHYDFLLSLSDKMGGNGLEHHQSSEDGTIPKYFLDWDKTPAGRDLLAHEYTHSWNGKFRRPADLWTPNFNVPMRDSLLWVYEGQTQYWGYVLAARSGLMTKQETLDAIAAVAATYDYRVGRSWRAMIDTTNDPIIAERRPLSWLSWQRSEDYYSEGQLIWLDADTLIREKTQGKRSLDDFAKTFFGVENGSFVTKTYTFDDVAAALNSVYPYDWATFLHQRLEGHGPGAPLDGLRRGGYRLVFDAKQSDYLKSAELRRKNTDLMFSIGLSVNKDAKLTDVQWDGPAFKAGATEGQEIMAVNGDAYTSDNLKDAITAAKGTSTPIELVVKDKDTFRTVRIDYHEGLRYPHLEREAGVPARLDDILAARK
jgi:predicted metalloprotease with PDZ domain